MKRFLAIVLSGIMMFSLMACGKEVEFDAKGYVQSALDAKYHRDYEAYAQGVGITEEEAKEQMVGEFNASLEEQIVQSGFTATLEELAEYQQMEADIRMALQYEVQEAIKDEENNYTVDVVVTPIDAYTILNDIFSSDLQEAVNNGATESEYMRVFLDSLQYSIDNAAKMEPVTFTFHLTHEEEDRQIVYYIDEEDVWEFDLIALNNK